MPHQANNRDRKQSILRSQPIIHRNRMYENNNINALVGNSRTRSGSKVKFNNKIRSFSELIPPISKPYNKEFPALEEGSQDSYP